MSADSRGALALGGSASTLLNCATPVALAGVTLWYAGWRAFPVDGACLSLLSWWLGCVAFYWLTAITGVLSLIDAQQLRLPVAVVRPSLWVMLLCCGVSSVLVSDLPRLGAVLGGALSMWVAYCVMGWVAPAGIGAGDIRLAPVLGAALGYVGWGAVVLGGLGAFVFGGVGALCFLTVGKISRSQGVPFGPAMFAGAWVGVCSGAVFEAADQWLFQSWL